MKKLSLISFCTVVMFLLSSNTALAIAYDCDADCDAKARYRYRCPSFSNPNKKCNGTNPVKRALCISDKKISCDLWDSVKDDYLNKVSNSIAKNETVVDTAERDGWTTTNCAVVGGGLIVLTATVYATPICAAAGVATAGIAAGACVAFISASSTLVTAAACTQLCHDKHLLDCK